MDKQKGTEGVRDNRWKKYDIGIILLIMIKHTNYNLKELI